MKVELGDSISHKGRRNFAFIMPWLTERTNDEQVKNHFRHFVHNHDILKGYRTEFDLNSHLVLYRRPIDADWIIALQGRKA